MSILYDIEKKLDSLIQYGVSELEIIYNTLVVDKKFYSITADPVENLPKVISGLEDLSGLLWVYFITYKQEIIGKTIKDVIPIISKYKDIRFELLKPRETTGLKFRKSEEKKIG